MKNVNFLEIKDAYYLNWYNLIVLFNTDEIKVVNFSLYINRWDFMKLENIDLFKKFQIVYSTIHWSDWKLWIDPEELYKIWIDVDLSISDFKWQKFKNLRVISSKWIIHKKRNEMVWV